MTAKVAAVGPRWLARRPLICSRFTRLPLIQSYLRGQVFSRAHVHKNWLHGSPASSFNPSFWACSSGGPVSDQVEVDLRRHGARKAIDVLELYPSRAQPTLDIGIKCMQVYVSFLRDDVKDARQRLQTDHIAERLISWTDKNVLGQIRTNEGPLRYF